MVCTILISYPHIQGNDNPGYTSSLETGIRSYNWVIKFDLATVALNIESAKLRLYVYDVS